MLECLRDVQKFPLRYNFCTSERGLHPQICQSAFAPAKTFDTSTDWQNSISFCNFVTTKMKLRQSALRYLQPHQKKPESDVTTSLSQLSFMKAKNDFIIKTFIYNNV